MDLTSSAFPHDSVIPAVYTADGDDVSPPLAWTQVPTGTRSLALVVDDLDSHIAEPDGLPWAHWIVYNLPPQMSALAEGASGELLDRVQEGRNSWGHVGYGGPAPLDGSHRYLFRLFALDAELEGLAHPTRSELERAMAGHILATASLMGSYRS